MKVVFLDVDGVLNGHEWDIDAQSNTISRWCVGNLNELLDQSGAKIVLSSAWRYMVIGGAMTLRGFEYLLRTHGVHAANRLVDITREDHLTTPETDLIERGCQIREWLDAHPEVTAYVALDDEDYGHTHYGIPLVRTNGKVGLTKADVDKAIQILKGAKS